MDIMIMDRFNADRAKVYIFALSYLLAKRVNVCLNFYFCTNTKVGKGTASKTTDSLLAAFSKDEPSPS